MSHVLLAGESWIGATVDHKGYDAFPHTQLQIGCRDFVAAIEYGGHTVHHLKSHDVAEHFPASPYELNVYDVVVLSDIGANSLLLHPNTFDNGRPFPNRLKLLRDWVTSGGGLMMAGGYLSFQGFQGKANYHHTAVEDVLPVKISPFDDREETPEGMHGQVTSTEHPITEGLDSTWPILLGYQRVEPRDDAEVLATIDGNVLLATRQVDSGRTLAFTSDISPHWAPSEFTTWTGYKQIFSRTVDWLANRSTDS
ncbi:glutamine amidotransferase [Spelaeicoccus albus]|uniref:Putative membrane protein n=1 Tax=Spelaeicoccus albus TaxID=1280376 RepID=A0A7Z0D4Q1_9MICO|nr:glutamine amidotransferase [Spelaeicoccus albus]NYI68800.1 putative membrane protein [Spelaeicoccus albus]